MPLVFNPNYNKLAVFRQEHQGVNVPGDGFFADVSRKDLQDIIDNTRNSLKKKRTLEPHGNANCATVAQAAALLKAADSRENGRITVVWGIHQDTVNQARGGGLKNYQHFTVLAADGVTNWHLYVDSQMKTITYLTPARGTEVRVENV